MGKLKFMGTKYYIDYTESNKILPIIGLSLHQVTEESGVQKKKFKINTESELQRITTIAKMLVCSLTEAEYAFNENCMVKNSANQEDAILMISTGDSSGIVTAPITILDNMFIRIKSFNTFKHIDEVFSNIKSNSESESHENSDAEGGDTNVLLNIAQSSNEDTRVNDNVAVEEQTCPGGSYQLENLENRIDSYQIEHLEDQVIPLDTINLNKTLKKDSVIVNNLIDNKQSETLEESMLQIEKSNENLKEVNNKLMIENHMLNKTILEYESKIAMLKVQVSDHTNMYETQIRALQESKDADTLGLKSEIKSLKERLIKAMSQTQQCKVQYEDLNIKHLKQVWETEKMNKLYNSLESMYMRVTKRNSQLEMASLTSNYNPEVTDLLFPDSMPVKRESVKFSCYEQPSKISYRQKQEAKDFLLDVKVQAPNKVQVPNNLQDCYRPNIQREQKSNSKSKRALKVHELPSSKIKQTDDKPKEVKDYWDNNKQLKLTGTMIKNKREGLWTEYNRHGVKLSDT